MSGMLSGFGFTDQGGEYAGIDTTIIGGNDRSAIPSDRTLISVASANSPTGATVTLPAVAGKTNYCTSVSLTYQGATAATVIAGTVDGGSSLVGGARVFPIAVPPGASVAANPLIIQFSPPLQAGAANATITFTFPSLGAGGTTAVSTINGYVA